MEIKTKVEINTINPHRIIASVYKKLRDELTSITESYKGAAI